MTSEDVKFKWPPPSAWCEFLGESRAVHPQFLKLNICWKHFWKLCPKMRKKREHLWKFPPYSYLLLDSPISKCSLTKQFERFPTPRQTFIIRSKKLSLKIHFAFRVKCSVEIFCSLHRWSICVWGVEGCSTFFAILRMPPHSACLKSDQANPQKTFSSLLHSKIVRELFHRVFMLIIIN